MIETEEFNRIIYTLTEEITKLSNRISSLENKIKNGQPTNN